jgi:hypothetical protein
MVSAAHRNGLRRGVSTVTYPHAGT